jgi:hypothetical protein
VGIVRIFIWNVGDAETSLDELRRGLEPVDAGVWITNDAAERFGLIAFGEVPDLEHVRELLGKDPEVAEEYDVEPVS